MEHGAQGTGFHAPISREADQYLFAQDTLRRYLSVLMNIQKQVRLQELRALLKQQFPEAHRGETAAPETDEVPSFSTGIPALDAVRLPKTGLIELTGASTAGVGLVLWSLIRQRLGSGHAMVLVDSMDSCDVTEAWPEEAMARLLWIRCHGVEEAMQAMDLLVRDGNVRHLVMDLQGVHKQYVPHPLWYRLRNVAEENGLWMLVTSREPIVPCAVMRCQLRCRFGLDDLNVPRETLLQKIAVHVMHRHASRPANPSLRQVG